MQSTDLEEIKAALWEQAYHQCTRVSWGVTQVISKVWFCLKCIIVGFNVEMDNLRNCSIPCCRRLIVA